MNEVFQALTALIIGALIAFYSRFRISKKSAISQNINCYIEQLNIILGSVLQTSMDVLEGEKEAEVAHHLFVAYNSYIKLYCTDIYNLNKGRFPIPQDRLIKLKQACDKVIEAPSSGTSQAQLIHAQINISQYYTRQIPEW
jgi:hypothetical protein